MTKLDDHQLEAILGGDNCMYAFDPVPFWRGLEPAMPCYPVRDEMLS